MNAVRFARGALVARLLSRAWRSEPVSPPQLAASDLARILDQLLLSGAGALAWRQVRGCPLADSPAGERLHSSYRVQCLRAAGQQPCIGPLIQKFRAHDIDPILIKGWSLARLYPEPGLRPYSDVDLMVAPEQVQAAAALLAFHHGIAVDLVHDEITRFDHRSWSELFSRSRFLDAGGTPVRVLAPEDQLRVLCIHFLKHGGWGPLWLCDIALLLESRSPEFDWHLFLGDDGGQRSWLAGALLLAHLLLGADLNGVPFQFDLCRLPHWVATTVLEQWGSPPVEYRAPFHNYLRRPLHLQEAVADRWPVNPIVSTLTAGARFGSWPRVVLQGAEVLSRVARCFLPGLSGKPRVRTGAA